MHIFGLKINRSKEHTDHHIVFKTGMSNIRLGGQNQPTKDSNPASRTVLEHVNSAPLSLVKFDSFSCVHDHSYDNNINK